MIMEKKDICDNELINFNNNLASKLDPYFVTGLTEAEGSFSISVHKKNRAKFKRNVKLEFTIKMLENETELLLMVKSFFNCGILWYYVKDNTIWFRIRDFSSIKSVLIPHFLKYPLRGTKYLDFLSFKEAFHIIESKEHLTEKGLDKLYNLSKSMNTGRKFLADVYYSPNHTKEDNMDYLSIDGHYISGFIAGDGCLTLTLSNKSFCIMSLQISQHINNRLLMGSIANYFNSPLKVYPHGTKCLQISLSGIKL